MPLENRLDVIRYVARRADDLGYEAFTLPETWSYDAHSLLAAVSLDTNRINFGPTVLSCWGRSAATISMGAATLAAMSGGRYVLGLGAGTPELAEGLHDQTFDHPADQLGRTVTQVRALLRGERAPVRATAHARPLKLNLPLEFDIPIWVAALGERTERIASEQADGWLPFLVPRSQLAGRIDAIQKIAESTGRPAGAVTIAPSVPTVVAETAAEAKQTASWFVAFYVVSMGGMYRTRLASAGFADEVRSIVEANPTGRTTIVPPDAEPLLNELTIYGTPATARAQLEPWYEAGADMPSLLLAPNLARDQLDLALTTFGSP
jgi:alkanesulfonate monooxygenase SsuD/methylene tetrahydromethanopterin reductase-like flavin-dependent oxidoreductase (luciferase family)